MAITLFENFRAVFYAPFYAALALNAFRDEGLDVRLKTSSKPGPTAGGLSDGEIGVWWGGPMRILVAHDQDPDCGLVGFCEIVTRDPFFLSGRARRPEFQLPDLEGLRIGTVSEVPTPWMCLQDDIRRAGFDPAMLDRVSDNPMTGNAQALRDGAIDVIQVFEPFVELLASEGVGHIWYAAAARGPTSYTTLYTTERTLAEHRDAVLAMTRAMYRTQKWLHGQDARTVSTTIAGFFPELQADTLTACIARYTALGLWGRDPLLPQDGFERLKRACLSGGLIVRGAEYSDCIDTSPAQSAIETDPPSM
jgi:NitT/TauT family transport system substrate-binding protein